MATQIRGSEQIKIGTVTADRLVGTDIATVGTITSGTWNGTTVAVGYGGTGATTASSARTNLGLAIGSDVQAYSSVLSQVAAETYTGSTATTTLGTITTGTWNGTALTASYVPSLDAINAPQADVAMNSHKITGLLDPSSNQDAATKAYVDNAIYLRSVKEPVRVALNSNVTLNSPGATLDGVSMSSGDRVLLFGQTVGAKNGIYVWNGAAVAMTRALDADSSAEMGPNHYCWVEEGTFQDQAFVCTTNAPITLDTTALAYVKFSGLGQITAGAGLTKTADTLNVVSANGGIVVNADNIALTLDGSTLSVGASGLKVASAGITSTEIATSAVGTSQIAANAVTAAKIAASVAGDGLGGGNGTALSVNCAGVVAIDSDAVTLQAFSAQVQSFNSTHFANSAGQFKIAADAISATEIAANAVGTSELASSSVTAAKLGFTAVAGESPSGTKDGSNKSFSLANTPAAASSLMLFLDGLFMTPGTHYTVSGSSLSLSEAPASDDDLRAVYFY